MDMMRCRFRAFVVSAAAVCLLGSAAGCATHSHKSVRMYEYSDEPKPVREVESESEWQMQSPGEMVSPGEIVEPDEATEEED